MPSESGTDSLARITGFLETHNGQRLAIAVFSIVAVLVLLVVPGSMLAYIFGLPLIFFIPGFAVVRMFFWKGTTPETKFVLSLGLSILVVIFLGLILTLTPIGLMSSTSRASLIVFTIGAVAVEARWLKADRPARNGKEEPKALEPEEAPEKLDKVVVAMIATALVVSAISLGLIVTAHYPSRTYFAMTDENGSADINTTRISGTDIALMIHMKNGENGPRVFTLIFHNWNSTALGSQNYSKTMQKGDLWNQTVVVHLPKTGVFRLDFDLYIQEAGKDAINYGNLHLWVSVA